MMDNGAKLKWQARSWKAKAVRQLMARGRYTVMKQHHDAMSTFDWFVPTNSAPLQVLSTDQWVTGSSV